MKNSKALKKITLCSLATVISGAAQFAYAHTVIQNSVTTGSTTYNSIVIGHTCESKGKKIPVVAQSVLFPTVSPIILKGDQVFDSTPTLTLGDVFETPAVIAKDAQGTPGTPGYKPAVVAKAAVPLDSLANIPQLIQNKDIFKFQREKTNATGNVIGFEGWGGKLDPTLHGLVPFRTSGLNFKTSSCAKKVYIKVAIADICKMSFPPQEGTANLWMPNTTTKFPNVVDGTSATAFAGSPATLTVERPLSTNPLPEGCGSGDDVYIYPSNADIDANLPIKKRWGK